MMWLFIFGGFIVLAIISIIFIYRKLRCFGIVKKIAGDSGKKSVLIRLPIIFALIAWCFLDTVTGVISVVHLFFFWLVAELLGFIVKKISKKDSSIYWQGGLAILVTVAYLSAGWYFAHHVYETDYELHTDKELSKGSIRAAVIGDSHVGSTFDGDGFAGYMKEIEKASPDVLVIVGDYVDDDTSKDDMEKSCRALGELKTKYGIYYVYGNHDRGYYNSRGFSAEELEAELTKNGVKVLKDETELIADSFYIVGRKDRSFTERLPMAELTKELDPSKYMIVLDHQPHDFEAEKNAGADLVLCGHTHGGQMFPIGITGELSGANEMTYGLRTDGNTNYIVTSGISDWAIPYKTATISEYVIIDIKNH
ncbi:MAG: metallophosphoesterase [Lachnospiraceae bacterium]|nr:metallophosphoesterase [Lachnospiraceae bacterium]